MNRIAGFLFFITLILSFTQCSKENEDEFSLGKVWVSLGLMETEETLGYNFALLLDNGDTLLPTSYNFHNFDPEDYERILVNYTLLGRVNNSEKTYYTKINGIRDILYKGLIELNEDNADSLGNDPVHITDLWKSGSKLNIEFQYYGYSKTHYINLAYTQSNINNTEALPIELNLLHNANNDEEVYLMNGIVTFKLDTLQEFGNDSIQFIIKSINLTGEEQNFTGTYKF
jgi:hypothetical protein